MTRTNGQNPSKKISRSFSSFFLIVFSVIAFQVQAQEANDNYNKVRLWTNTNFSGSGGFSTAQGSHNVNATYKSVNVPWGLQVTLYDQANQTGNSIIFFHGDADITDIWDVTTRSFTVSRSNRINFQGAGDSGTIRIFPNQDEEEASVAFYEEKPGSGYAWVLGLDGWENEKDFTIGHTGIGNQTSGVKFLLQADGKLGIGTTSPSEKLHVAGKIRATGLKCDVDAGSVPDYVFTTGYHLNPLEEVEAYIEANHHLPAVPSATEMEKDGMEVVALSLTLLEKIEELTLYTIQQQKQIKDLQQEVNTLKNK
ncbi:MAG: hypothetical protein AAGA66_01025 [Bacteroidota bacterium]